MSGSVDGRASVQPTCPDPDTSLEVWIKPLDTDGVLLPIALHHPIYIPTHHSVWNPWLLCCASGNFLSPKLELELIVPLDSRDWALVPASGQNL